MSTQFAVRRWTYEAFAALPDDGNRYEIIAGDLYVSPGPHPNHNQVIAQILVLIEIFLRQHALNGRVYPGPIDVLFAEGDYLEPDLVFVQPGRRGIISNRGFEGAPDLIVEVLSDSTASRDRGIKRERYAHYGVPEYWIVDVDRRHVEVYHLQEDPMNPKIVRDRLTWSPVPGGPVLEIPLETVFEKME